MVRIVLDDSPESMLENFVYIDGDIGVVKRHYGPGPHPGTGTPQDVHAGGYTGFGGREQSDQIQRYRNRLGESRARFSLGFGGEPTPIEARRFSEAVEAMVQSGEGHIQVTDPDRGLWASIGFHEESFDFDAVDWDAEYQMFIDAHDYMIEALNDPDFADLARRIDRDGGRMAENARRFIEQLDAARDRGEEMGNVFQFDRRFSYNLIFTNDREYMGAGSSSVGGLNAKVFWQPLTLPENEQELGKSGSFIFGLSPAFVQFHEMHHGFGSGTELDTFSDTISLDFYARRGGQIPGYLAHKGVDQQIFSLYLSGQRRLSGEFRDITLERRRALGWLYNRNPEFIEATLDRRRAYNADPDNAPYSHFLDNPDRALGRIKRWARDYGR